MRAELDSITAGFNKLPTLTANNVVFVNASGTALEARAGIDGVVIGGTTPAAGTFTTLTLTSGFVLPLGSAAAPSLSFTSDSNNGWWSPGADIQAWSTAGLERMRLNAAGAVSISAPSAGHTLTLNHTAGTGTGAINTTDGTVVGIIKSVAASALSFNVVSNHAMTFGTNDIERMRLDANGRIGIGASPSAGGTVTVKSADVTLLKLESTTARGSGQAALAFFDPTGQKGYFGYGSANDTLHMYQGLNSSLVLFTNGTQRLDISGAGNVTIADPTSGYPLTVSANGTLAALFKNSNSGAVNAGIAFGSPGSTNLSAGVAGLAQSATTGALLLQYVTGGALTEGARIDTGGNLGIGVAPTYKVDAAGPDGNGYRYVAAGIGTLFGVSGVGVAGTVTNHNFAILTNSSTRMVFDTSGLR
jgi:hypothetical protein